MARKATDPRKGDAFDGRDDGAAQPKTVKVTLHLAVETAQRLGIESAMRRVSQSAIAEEVLKDYLSRWALPSAVGYGPSQGGMSRCRARFQAGGEGPGTGWETPKGRASRVRVPPDRMNCPNDQEVEWDVPPQLDDPDRVLDTRGHGGRGLAIARVQCVAAGCAVRRRLAAGLGGWGEHRRATPRRGQLRRLG